MRDIRFECIVQNVEFKRYNFCTNEKKNSLCRGNEHSKRQILSWAKWKKSKICLYSTTSQ